MTLAMEWCGSEHSTVLKQGWVVGQDGSGNPEVALSNASLASRLRWQGSAVSEPTPLLDRSTYEKKAAQEFQQG